MESKRAICNFVCVPEGRGERGLLCPNWPNLGPNRAQSGSNSSGNVCEVVLLLLVVCARTRLGSGREGAKTKLDLCALPEQKRAVRETPLQKTTCFTPRTPKLQLRSWRKTRDPRDGEEGEPLAHPSRSLGVIPPFIVRIRVNEDAVIAGISADRGRRERAYERPPR